MMRAIALAVILIGLSAARAHDASRPELDGWFMSLHSKGHVPCCDGADAHHLSDVDWESRDGHYRVRIDGQWWDVPDEAVIDDQPNRAGATLVWPFPVRDADGKTKWMIRCFMPGSMT